MLGAGGAGRAAAWALKQAGAEVLIWNRTPEKARALAAELGIEAVGAPVEADLLVNATSVGLDPAISEDQALRELGLAPADERLEQLSGDDPMDCDGPRRRHEW